MQEHLGIYEIKSYKSNKLKKLFEITDEDLRVNLEECIKWSPKNIDLIKLIKLEGYSDKICNEKYLYSFY